MANLADVHCRRLHRMCGVRHDGFEASSCMPIMHGQPVLEGAGLVRPLE